MNPHEFPPASSHVPVKGHQDLGTVDEDLHQVMFWRKDVKTWDFPHTTIIQFHDHVLAHVMDSQRRSTVVVSLLRVLVVT